MQTNGTPNLSNALRKLAISYGVDLAPEDTNETVQSHLDGLEFQAANLARINKVILRLNALQFDEETAAELNKLAAIIRRR